MQLTSIAYFLTACCWPLTKRDEKQAETSPQSSVKRMNNINIHAVKVSSLQAIFISIKPSSDSWTQLNCKSQRPSWSSCATFIFLIWVEHHMLGQKLIWISNKSVGNPHLLRLQQTFMYFTRLLASGPIRKWSNITSGFPFQSFAKFATVCVWLSSQKELKLSSLKSRLFPSVHVSSCPSELARIGQRCLSIDDHKLFCASSLACFDGRIMPTIYLRAYYLAISSVLKTIYFANFNTTTLERLSKASVKNWGETAKSNDFVLCRWFIQLQLTPRQSYKQVVYCTWTHAHFGTNNTESCGSIISVTWIGFRRPEFNCIPHAARRWPTYSISSASTARMPQLLGCLWARNSTPRLQLRYVTLNDVRSILVHIFNYTSCTMQYVFKLPYNPKII